MGLLFGLTGPPGAGKDAAALHLVEAHRFHRLAFADEIRRALLVLDPCVKGCAPLSEIIDKYGWDLAKSHWPEVRRLLQVLGTELGRELHGPDVWVNKVFAAIADLDPDQRIVISDVRFENEATAVHLHGGQIVRLTRNTNSPDAVMSHRSEVESAGLKPDCVIANEGTLEQLHGALDRLVYRSLS